MISFDVARAGIGFNSDRNEVSILTASDVIHVPEASKQEVAQKILEAALRLRQEHSATVLAPSSKVDL